MVFDGVKPSVEGVGDGELGGDGCIVCDGDGMFGEGEGDAVLGGDACTMGNV